MRREATSRCGIDGFAATPLRMIMKRLARITCVLACAGATFSGGTLATLHHDRAIELRQTGEYERAIADYSQAIRMDAELTGAYAGRGLAYEGKGEVEKAKTNYRKALAVPQKNDGGKWAHEIARERLTALGEK